MINVGHTLNSVLIDFGYVSKYMNEYNEHIPQEVVAKFQGNLMFASLDQLNFIRPSRRSDLHSLCYLLIFMLNDFDMPYIE